MTSTLTLATVNGEYRALTGQPLAGKKLRISLVPDSVVFSDDNVIVPDVDEVVTLDENGGFSIQLVTGGNPSGWTYRIVELFGNTREYYVTVPEGTHRLADLAPVSVSPGVVITRGDPGPPGEPGPAGEPGVVDVNDPALRAAFVRYEDGQLVAGPDDEVVEVGGGITVETDPDGTPVLVIGE
jgi:hypothetical protein